MTTTGPPACLLLTQLALVLGAGAAALVHLVLFRRRTGAYGLSDAIAAGAAGGVAGLVFGAALCVLAEGGRGWVGVARPYLAFGGLALIEGAVVGVAVAFALDWLKRGPAAPPVDSDPDRR